AGAWAGLRSREKRSFQYQVEHDDQEQDRYSNERAVPFVSHRVTEGLSYSETTTGLLTAPLSWSSMTIMEPNRLNVRSWDRPSCPWTGRVMNGKPVSSPSATSLSFSRSSSRDMQTWSSIPS